MVPLLGSVAWEQISSVRGFFRRNDIGERLRQADKIEAELKIKEEALSRKQAELAAREEAVNAAVREFERKKSELRAGFKSLSLA
jgi:hypothetical protein